jgi:hypothetical protein
MIPGNRIRQMVQFEETIASIAGGFEFGDGLAEAVAVRL